MNIRTLLVVSDLDVTLSMLAQFKAESTLNEISPQALAFSSLLLPAQFTFLTRLIDSR